ncbi:alpha-L-rhamnosidase [Xylocopilactobacillus apis]|uniref:alpha-L-rhamnosidase n=1 Tax=Xylocopilactobacillus apis TaxID=2932183 RepID=A0AAU9D2V5_9LACO|nr:alpha-L-rhamnosidase [Xylocopilactobacillus apis]BDR56630.1 alfa-L-rhamnosidase [Xylocopilactobacillus apis]
MKISSILINHMHEPVGFQLNDLRVEFKVESDQFFAITKKLSIYSDENPDPCWQSDWLDFNNNYFDVDLKLKSRTHYRVLVAVKSDDEEVEAESFFETGKMNESFEANWIGNSDKNIQNTLFKKDFKVSKQVKRARLYITGLGLYETYIDHQKVGDEFLTPGVTAYDQWVQVQTYDVTSLLKESNHELLISCGDGWYKGNYGFDGGKDCIYGDQQLAIAEYHLDYKDGTHEVISTDQSWQTTSGQITKSAIYYGEDLDETIEIGDWQQAVEVNHDKNILQDRLSLPIKVKEKLSVNEIISTPANEQVLDFGQNQAGWLEFYNREPKGTKIIFQFGEILQEGNFYRDNLREARAAFEYVSDGVEKWVRPHFTYFGYRYVKVEGNTKPLRKEDYQAAVMYSDLAETGNIETNNPKVNRLFQNIIWGQKSNFFDVPTDCPQRDERLGWTGDAEIFSNTAALNMDVFAFFKKYARDLSVEQEQHDGMVTMYAPAMGQNDGGAAVWGDAATIIPWNMYEDYGDPAILKQNYQSMKSWVDWITKNTQVPNLWVSPFQFGDWLALDGENPAMPTGKTDEDYIASIYYYYSSLIVSQTAKILNQFTDEQKYAELAEAIKNEIQAEYITPKGRLALETQTAYILALQFDLVDPKYRKRVVNDLVARLHKDNDHLKTGFVGTPYLCTVLSRFNEHKLATKIFLNDDYPSWLNEVNLGATTIWERWNSVQSDGSMNPEGMNSLNHYSAGTVMEWTYKYLLGINGHTPGYQKITFAPQFDYRLPKVSGYFETPYGKFSVNTKIETDENHTINLSLTIPFGVNVHVELPRSNGVSVKVNDKEYSNGKFDLQAGNYEISYQPTENYIETYHPDTPVTEILANENLVSEIDKIDPILNFFKNDPNSDLAKMSLTKLDLNFPFINIEPDHLKKINQLLEKTPVPGQGKEF